MWVWIQRRGEGARLNPDSLCAGLSLLWFGGAVIGPLIYCSRCRPGAAVGWSSNGYTTAESGTAVCQPQTPDWQDLSEVSGIVCQRQIYLSAARRTLTVWNSVLSLNRTGLIRSDSNKLFMPDWNETRQSLVCSQVSPSESPVNTHKHPIFSH